MATKLSWYGWSWRIGALEIQLRKLIKNWKKNERPKKN